MMIVTVILALVAVLSLGAAITLYYNNKAKAKRVSFLEEYTREVEAKHQDKEKQLREAQFQASILEAKINQIDQVLRKLGYTEVRNRIKPFLLSVEAANHGTR